MKIDARGKVVETATRTIPHNEKGDPCFTALGIEANITSDGSAPEGFWSITKGSILSQFTCEEVVQLVNRQLYAIEYQRTVHRERARGDAEKMKELKQKAEQMFGKKWNMCSELEVQKAAAAIAKERMEK